MNESKLNMSKLAAESGQKRERSGSGQGNDSERLDLSRLGDITAVKGDADEAVRKDDERLYQAGLKLYADIYNAVRAEEAFSVDPAVSLIRKIITGLQEPKSLLLLAVGRDYRQDTIVHHSLNVAIISLMVASQLGIQGESLVTLGTTALLHDIGTARVSQSLYNKPASLTDNELKELRQRTVLSQQILEQSGDQHACLSTAAVQVYERLDGTGYPSGLKAGEIHEYARIIGLTDLYEALTHSRPHRARFLHFQAFREILRSGKQSFDRRCLKALLNTVSLYPVLSLVQLNSGAVGRVIETHSRDPLRPRLKILFDAQKMPVSSERTIDLRENPLLFVVDAVAEEDFHAAAV
jgi:HD-GYP domain-containing protein (c-di-GMP phosphodiesterase class II)